MSRVLHVHSGNLYGGVETLLVTLARYRRLAPEVEHHFALCFEGRLSGELRDAGAAVHRLGPVRLSRPHLVLRARRGLRRLLRGGDFDAVVFHSAWSHAIFAPVARAAGCSLVFWLHGAVARRGWVERWASRVSPDRVLCNSAFTATFVDRIFGHVATDVVYCPVPGPPPRLTLTERASLRTELGTADDAVVIAQVGRLEWPKGQRVLLEALGELRDLPGWVCWQVGGAQRPLEVAFAEELRSLAINLGIADRVRFLGQRSDVDALLGAADLYCQPNLAPEGFGITYIEALYAGLPVVTTRLGGAREIVDDATGILIPPGDPHVLATTLRRLVMDLELRRLLAAGGPARADAVSGVRVRVPQIAGILSSVGGDVA